MVQLFWSRDEEEETSIQIQNNDREHDENFEVEEEVWQIALDVLENHESVYILARNVILSENMDFSQIKAVMENNLLVIYIPKIRFDSQHIKIDRISS